MRIELIADWHLSAQADRRAGRVVSDGDDSLMVLPLRGAPWPASDPLDLRGPVF